MKKIEDLIKLHASNFSNVDKQIAKYVLLNHKKVCSMSINNLAEAAFVSTSSVLRFAQKLGFHGFSAFKYFLAWNEDSVESQEDITFQAIGEAVNKMLSDLGGPTILSTMHYIKESRRIFILATGLNQQYQARDLQQHFLQQGINMVLLPSNSGSVLNKQISETVTSNDLLIIFSASGENTVVKDFLKLPTLIQTPIISFTNNLDSWLSTHSNCVFALSNLDNNTKLNPYFSGLFHILIDFLALQFISFNSNTENK